MYSLRRCVRRFPAALCLVLAACARGDSSGEQTAAPVGAVDGLRGTALAEPLAKPSFVLRRSAGSDFDFARETEGRVTLLFFGYTHCPDVCPLHMANIAAVLRKMPWSARDAIRVVFVTTDPERDTPERLRRWLANFDPTFIGLRGPLEEVNRIQVALGLAPASRQGDTSDGYLVGHAAQVIAFGRDNFARVVYPFGTRQEDWAHDLPRLAAGAGSGTGGAASSAAALALGISDTFAIAPAVIATTSGSSSAVLYVSILNAGDYGDTLRSVALIGAAQGSFHVSTQDAGSVTMREVPWLEIPPRARVDMQPGGVHVMLEGLSPALNPGASTAVELRFARHGSYTLPAAVVSYAQLDSALALARSALESR